jgi:hypothetical protein
METVIENEVICETCGDEDECHDDCFCEECRSAWDEYEELSRDYRRSTSGY